MLRRTAPLLAAALAALAVATAPAANAAAFKLDIYFSATPAKLTRINTPTFALKRNVHFGVKSQTCRIDTGKWATCSLSWKPGHITDGTHTAQVKLVMTDGRTASGSYTWTTDATAPATPTLTGGSSSWVNATSKTVTFHATDPAPASGVVSYSYRLNGGAPKTSTSGQITVSAQGTTTVTVTATDKAGNVSAAATGTVKLDSEQPTPPSFTRNSDTLVLSSLGEDPVTGPGGQVTVDGPAQYEISTDNGQTWTAPADYTSAFQPTDSGTTYEIRGRNQNSLGVWSDWSTPDSNSTIDYETVPTVPTVTQIATDAEDVTWTWTAGIDSKGSASQYEFQIYKNGDLASDYTGAATLFSNSGTQPLGTGMWDSFCGDTIVFQVRALGNYGQDSDWSTPTTWDTPACG